MPDHDELLPGETWEHRYWNARTVITGLKQTTEILLWLLEECRFNCNAEEKPKG